MTAPTPPAVSDAAVEAYTRAHDRVWHYAHDDARNRGTHLGPAETAVTGDRAVRAGLAAALPHLLPAAPSGETAPTPRRCNIPDATPDEVEIEAWQNYEGPSAEYRMDMGPYAGPPHTRIELRHRCGWRASFRPAALQWTQVADRVAAHFGAVPGVRTHAAATPADVDLVVQALVDDYGWTCRRDLREIVTATLRLAAAPSWEQPTAKPAGEVGR